MLLNLTNHPSSNWPPNQKEAARDKYGQIQDLAFPQIDPEWDEGKIDQLADEYLEKIKGINPQAVHVMGEMTFTFRLVAHLKHLEIPCVASTTIRTVFEDGTGGKFSQFQFVRFRSY